MAVESSEDDDMPSLLDEKSEGSGNDEPQKRASATREKKTSKTSMKTPRSPAQVEESAEVKAQKRLEAKAIHMLEDILADTAQIKENSEVVKSYIAAAKDLEAEITLSLAQRNRKTPQDALNLHLTQLQHAHPQLELRLTHLIATEKENKRKQAEQKEVGRKEKDIARKKATAEAKKKKAKVKHDEEERLRTEQEELDASVKRALDEQKEQKRRAELDDTERKTLLRWNGSCSVVQFMCERLPAMPVATWEKQRKVHNGQCPICIEDFDEGERVWRMPCAHAACEDCLEPYLKPFIDTSAAVGGKGQSAYAYAMCALCRAAFDPEEQKAADLAQSEDRGRREQENAPPTPQANVTIWAAPRTANVAPPLRGSDAVFHPLGITALAEGSQAGGSTPLTPETVPDVSATLFCAGLSDVFCGTDGEALLKVYFEQWGPVISVKIRGVRTEAERPFAFVALTDLRHATLALGIRHPFKVKRCERRDGAASSESAPSAANNNDSNHSVNHLDTTDTPTGSAVDKLEDRTLWVGDLHKLSEAGDAVLVPLITLYFGRFGPLDPARPLRVRQANGGGSQGKSYTFVVFEHVRSAEAALCNAVVSSAQLRIEPHKESKHMHPDSNWRQGEASPVAVATATPAIMAVSAVAARKPLVNISPAALLNVPTSSELPRHSPSNTARSTLAGQQLQVITTAQIQAVKGLIMQRCIDVPIGHGNLVKYVEGTFPEINKAKVIEAAFSGQVGCKVFQWGVADLAALMMKLGYFAGPS